MGFPSHGDDSVGCLYPTENKSFLRAGPLFCSLQCSQNPEQCVAKCICLMNEPNSGTGPGKKRQIFFLLSSLNMAPQQATIIDPIFCVFFFKN